MKQLELPSRVRVLVLGGGIHGVGILHDMASRGWQDIFLVEKKTLGCGTSSRSTKLIHGGIRYLKRVSQFSMVNESLHERHLLLNLAPDIVHPIEIFFPILKEGGDNPWVIKSGLMLYDKLAGKERISKHSTVSAATAEEKTPLLKHEICSKVYSFWDAQTDDLALVQRVAASAVKLGAQLREDCKAVSVAPSPDGWNVAILDAEGRKHNISALYVINALGPWSNLFLTSSGLEPVFHGINNKGSHVVLPDLNLKAGLLMQSPEDGRIFFLLPWLNHTLLGTTEELYEGDLDKLEVTPEEITYLLARCNRYLKSPLTVGDVKMTFAGLRWLAVEKNKDLSATSRECLIGKHSSQRGLLFTIYGGKLTSYRSLAENIGDQITSHFGEFRPARTNEKAFWAQREEILVPLPPLLNRFP